MIRNKRFACFMLVVVIAISIFALPLQVYAENKTHIVSKGDTIYDIAKWYGLSVTSIKTENGIQGNLIKPGEKLVVPIYENVNNNYQQDRYLLAKMIYAEARGESFIGQVAVGAVILNRVKSPKFPKTIAGVIFQPYAFTSVSDGQFFMEPDEEAYKAADAALSGWDPTGGALYYYNPAKVSSPWIWSRPIITQIGEHIFAR